MGKLVLNTPQYCHLINETELVYCKHKNGYTHFFIKSKGEIKIRKPLAWFAKQLTDNLHMYTHRCFLVNRNQIESYHPKTHSYLTMSNGHQVPVSLRRKKELIQFIQKTHTVQI